MDTKHHLIHATDFIRTTTKGDLDLEATRQMLLTVASLVTPPGSHDIFLDCRETTSKMSLSDITKLVDTMLDHRRLFGHKLAILTPEGEKFDTMQFMENYAVNRGLKVAAFTDYEQAINWLMPYTELPASTN
jgi:hypothetical protein